MARYVSLITSTLQRQSQEPIDSFLILALKLAKVFGQVVDATQATRILEDLTRHDQFTRLGNAREQHPFRKLGRVIAGYP
jgi:hypothetical protein